MKYVPPGTAGSIVDVAPHYDNFIGGKWLPPTTGEYRTNLSPATAGAVRDPGEPRRFPQGVRQPAGADGV